MKSNQIPTPRHDTDLLDQLSELIIYQDTQNIIKWANKAAVEKIGRPLSEIVGKKCFKVWHELNNPCENCKASEAINTGKVQESEAVSPDGSRWLMRRIPEFNENGDIIGVYEIGLDITERTVADTQREYSEHRFQRMAESVEDGITIIEQGKIVFMNRRVIEIFGYEHHELMNMNGIELAAPEEKSRLRKINEKAKKGGDFPDTLEFWIIRKDGKKRYIRNRYSINRTNNEITGRYVITTDITEAKLAEIALRESEEHHRSILENQLVGIWRSRIEDGMFLWLNKTAALALGFDDPEELVNKHTAVEFYTDEQRRALVAELKSKGEVSGFEAQFTLRDGTKKDILLAAKIFPEKGYIQGVVIDITDKKKAERLLRQSDRKYRNLVEAVSDGLAIADLDENIFFANGAACRIFGYPREEIIGMNLCNLVVEDDVDKVKTGTDLRLEGQSTKYEFSIKRKDGPVRKLHVSASPYYDDNGKVAGSIGIFSDVTDLKKAEEERKKLQEQLERAQRMESLGVLAGGVAHDLNNLLGPLVAYPEIILMKLPEDSPARKQVEMMGNAAKDAAEVIQDLLTLARRGRYEMSPLNINDVIEAYLASVSLVELKANNPKVIIDEKLDPNISNIQGSSPHLMKVIMNLVVNAFDAMSEGGRLKIETTQKHLTRLDGGHAEVGDGEYVILKIRDSGVGIEKKYLKNIFEPYYSKKEMGSSGSGLGLSVVYGILKDHKGYYDIFSEVGRGTEFVLYFPVCKEEVNRPDKIESDFGGTESILVIDDVPEQREIASDLLSSLGYKVNTAENGRAAVEYLKKNKADIILLDMIMEKDFDGLDTYREIIKIHPGQKAIIVSGFSATHRVNKAMDLGAGNYIRKPYSRDQLAQAIRAELDKKQAAPVK